MNKYYISLFIQNVENYRSILIFLNKYLDKINKNCNFIDVFYENLGKSNILTLICPKCDEKINLNKKTKIIKNNDIYSLL